MQFEDETEPRGHAQRVQVLARCLERIRSTPWMSCFLGVEPPGITPLDMDDPRVAWLRQQPRWRYMLQTDRFSRFWLRELYFTQFTFAVEYHSIALNAAPVPVTLREIARLSGISVAKAQEMLEAAERTGDIIKLRSPADGRLMVLDLSPEFEAALMRRHRQFFALMAGFTGRADPLARLSPPAWAELRRRILHANLHVSGRVSAMGSGETRRTFLYLIQDLFVDGPVLARDFTAVEAERLGVTAVTIRNTLAFARQQGWIEPGPLLVPTAKARRRYGLALATLEVRYNAWLEIAELLIEEPALAPLLRPTADGEPAGAAEALRGAA